MLPPIYYFLQGCLVVYNSTVQKICESIADVIFLQLYLSLS